MYIVQRQSIDEVLRSLHRVDTLESQPARPEGSAMSHREQIILNLSDRYEFDRELIKSTIENSRVLCELAAHDEEFAAYI